MAAILSNCSGNEYIEEFENVLGKKNSETLNFLVSDFENDFLKKQYPNLSKKKAYQRFLVELSNLEIEHWQKISKEAREVFKRSDLRLEIYCVADTSWLDLNPAETTSPLIRTKLKCKTEDGSIMVDSSAVPFNHKISDLDSILKMHENFVETNFEGKYNKALNSISDSSPFMTKYVEIRNSFGILPPEMVASEMIESDVDVDDYFIKRLIITEMMY
ncbi:hypothetical protein [Aquimarina spongiae]|nr:hypothetical protein [Aquimarina spongiae]